MRTITKCNDCNANLKIGEDGQNCFTDWHDPARARDIDSLQRNRESPDRVQNGDDESNVSEMEA